MGDLKPCFVLCEKPRADILLYARSRAWSSNDVHHRESLSHHVNHSSLGEAV